MSLSEGDDVIEAMTEPTAKFHCIDHIALSVRDLEGAGQFFTNVFGFQLIRRLETRGKRTGMLSAKMEHNGIKFVLCQGAEPDSQVSKLVAFGSRCREAGIRPSMGSVGHCYDNAMCESFNATLECELLVRHRFKTQREASLAVFDLIEGWYNPHRRRSALGYLSPNNYELLMSEAA